MRTGIAALATLLLLGCVTGPRPYDGVLGYQLTTTSAFMEVSYVDEAKVSPAKTLQKITQACAGKLNASPANVTVRVQSESLLEQPIAMNVPIPVGGVDNGSSKSNGGRGPNANMQNTIVQNEAVTRMMKLRKTVAICSR